MEEPAINSGSSPSLTLSQGRIVVDFSASIFNTEWHCPISSIPGRPATGSLSFRTMPRFGGRMASSSRAINWGCRVLAHRERLHRAGPGMIDGINQCLADIRRVGFIRSPRPANRRAFGSPTGRRWESANGHGHDLAVESHSVSKSRSAIPARFARVGHADPQSGTARSGRP